MLARSALRTSAGAARSFSTSRTSNLAKMNLIGRLGAQPQTANDKQGREIMIYSVATNDRPTTNADGSKNEPTTTWHRVLSYNLAGKDYLTTLAPGTLVHIEADFKKRSSNEDGKYSEQTLLLLKSIDVLAKPSGAKATEQPPAESS